MTLEEITKKLNNNKIENMHQALLIHEDPISGGYSYRVGYFEEFYEAEEWINGLKKCYTEKYPNIEFETYINGVCR